MPSKFLPDIQVESEKKQLLFERYSSLTDEVTEAVRVIERCLKESRCLDMESLCIVAEEKVWLIRQAKICSDSLFKWLNVIKI